MKPNPEQKSKKGRILITGSKGVIGSILSKSLQEDFWIFQLDNSANTDSQSEFAADIADQETTEQVFRKVGQIDCIIHLAASSSPVAPWKEVLRNNIIGTKKIYECVRKYKVKKIIFASSTHLMAYEGYPQTSPLGRPISPSDPPRPDSDYGTSKGFGEILARQYYDLYGIQTICIRIGSVASDDKPTKPYEKLYLSHNDLAQVFRKALESNIPFGIYFATSENEKPTFDITKTREDLGYEPMDGTSKK